MKYLFVLSLVLFVTITTCEVITLSGDHASFLQTVRNGERWFVEFYAPWCGHCKSLAPVWEALSKEVEGVKIAQVDCTLNEKICGNQLVSSYPTLIYFKDFDKVKYYGDRSLDALIKFALSDPQPSNAEEVEGEISQVIDLTDETFAAETEKGAWIVAFYAPWCSHCKKLLPLWDKLSLIATEYKVARVDATVERELSERFDIRSMPTIKVFIDGDIYDYRGGRAVPSFDKFIMDKIHDHNAEYEKELEEQATSKESGFTGEPNVIVLNADNFDEHVAGRDFFVKFYAPWCGHCTRLAPIWEELSTKPQFNIGKVDCTVESELKRRFRITGYPSLIFFKANGEEIRYTGARSKSALVTFIVENSEINVTPAQ